MSLHPGGAAHGQARHKISRRVDERPSEKLAIRTHTLLYDQNAPNNTTTAAIRAANFVPAISLPSVTYAFQALSRHYLGISSVT